MKGLAAAAVLVVLVGPGPSAARLLDGMVARVDGRVVTWSQVLQEIVVRRVLGGAEEGADPRAVRDALVRRCLFAAEADRLRLEVEGARTEEDVRALLDRVERQAGWAPLAAVGLDRSGLERRAREILAMERFLDLRREMTFVPESRVRAYYRQHPDRFAGRTLAEARDEVRARLVEQELQEELDEWVDLQVRRGRVAVLELPGTQTP
ncbi:MAG: hypothetical protein Kow0092_10180 [Deferrisomatales bacterium]